MSQYNSGLSAQIVFTYNVPKACLTHYIADLPALVKAYFKHKVSTAVKCCFPFFGDTAVKNKSVLAAVKR